jgi:hypothetical protein
MEDLLSNFYNYNKKEEGDKKFDEEYGILTEKSNFHESLWACQHLFTQV